MTIPIWGLVVLMVVASTPVDFWATIESQGPARLLAQGLELEEPAFTYRCKVQPCQSPTISGGLRDVVVHRYTQEWLVVRGRPGTTPYNVPTLEPVHEEITISQSNIKSFAIATNGTIVLASTRAVHSGSTTSTILGLTPRPFVADDEVNARTETAPSQGEKHRWRLNGSLVSWEGTFDGSVMGQVTIYWHRGALTLFDGRTDQVWTADFQLKPVDSLGQVYHAQSTWFVLTGITESPMDFVLGALEPRLESRHYAGRVGILNASLASFTSGTVIAGTLPEVVTLRNGSLWLQGNLAGELRPGNGRAYEATLHGRLAALGRGGHLLEITPSAAIGSGLALAILFLALLKLLQGGTTHHVFMSLYTHLTKPRVLDSKARTLLLELVRQNAGITVPALARLSGETSRPSGTLMYHLRRLEEFGFIRSAVGTKERHYFAADMVNEDEIQRAACLAHPETWEAAEIILKHAGRPLHELSNFMTGTPRTARQRFSLQANRLCRVGLAEGIKSGRRRLYLPSPRLKELHRKLSPGPRARRL